MSQASPQPAAAPVPEPELTIAPAAVVFLSSLVFMIIELDAGRLTAWHVGSSLYSWTTVIVVMFGGMSAGNWVGGRISETRRPRRVLGRLFFTAMLLALALQWSNFLVYASDDGWLQQLTEQKYELPAALRSVVEGVIGSLKRNFDRPGRVLIASLPIYFPPAFVLGMISPLVAKLAIDRAVHRGGAVGSVYAWGAVGSIVGTFLAGFVLIDALGTRGVLCVCAAILGVTGALVGVQRILLGGGTVVAIFLLALASGPWKWSEDLGRVFYLREPADVAINTLYTEESDYQFVRAYRAGYQVEVVEIATGATAVKEVNSGQYAELAADPAYRVRIVRELRALTLDHLVHGYIWLRMPPGNSTPYDPRVAEFDSRDLHYTYEQVYALLTHRVAKRAKELPLRTLSLGAGTYTFPRYLHLHYADSRHDVAEIDPAVTRANERALKLDLTKFKASDGSPAMRAFHTDARNFVEAARLEGWKYDVVYGDAFNHYSIPFHLTTKEFHDQIALLLRPGGAYLANVIDKYETMNFLSWYALTLRETFPHVYVVCMRPRKVVTTADGRSRPAETVEFDGVTLELSDGSNREPIRVDAGEVYSIRTVRGLNRVILHDGSIHEAPSVRWVGGRATLLGRPDAAGKRESVTVDGSTLKSIREESRTGRETFVIAASKEPLDLSRVGWADDDPRFSPAVDRHMYDPQNLTVLTEAEMQQFFRRTKARVFTDAYAPVDNLLLPLFRDDN